MYTRPSAASRASSAAPVPHPVRTSWPGHFARPSENRKNAYAHHCERQLPFLHQNRGLPFFIAFSSLSAGYPFLKDSRSFQLHSIFCSFVFFAFLPPALYDLFAQSHLLPYFARIRSRILEEPPFSFVVFCNVT